jgi:hypothetical protein
MPALVDLQKALQKHLLEENNAIVDCLVKPVKGSLADRLAIYANAYRLRFIEALQKEYLYLSNYLGEAVFTELAEAYIDEYPSHFYSIADFSKCFPQFLATARIEQGYLSELAQLIQTLSLSLEAADGPVLNQATLSEVPLQHWPSLCFKYHPSVHNLAFQWNTFTLWKALVQKITPPVAYKENSYCIVWRKELQSYAISVTEAEYSAFQAFQKGACFADVSEMVYRNGLVAETETATYLASCLIRWLNNHWFSEVYLS